MRPEILNTGYPHLGGARRERAMVSYHGAYSSSGSSVTAVRGEQQQVTLTAVRTIRERYGGVIHVTNLLGLAWIQTKNRLGGGLAERNR